MLTDGNPLIGAEIDYRYSTYPAVKIARLAVDTERRKGNIGRQLVQWALGIAAEHICPHVGCRFVMVDSKKAAVKFYEKCGFTILDTEANHKRPSPVMFVDLSKI